MANTKVLVVDDDPDLVVVCSLILENEGYSVEAAQNGCDAVDKLLNNNVDVVLLDVMMPSLDGLTVCRMVKESSHIKHTPVIIMSASEVLQQKGKAMADAVICKPFDIDHLVNTVSRFAPAV